MKIKVNTRIDTKPICTILLKNWNNSKILTVMLFSIAWTPLSWFIWVWITFILKYKYSCAIESMVFFLFLRNNFENHEFEVQKSCTCEMSFLALYRVLQKFDIILQSNNFGVSRLNDIIGLHSMHRNRPVFEFYV